MTTRANIPRRQSPTSKAGSHSPFFPSSITAHGSTQVRRPFTTSTLMFSERIGPSVALTASSRAMKAWALSGARIAWGTRFSPWPTKVGGGGEEDDGGPEPPGQGALLDQHAERDRGQQQRRQVGFDEVVLRRPLLRDRREAGQAQEPEEREREVGPAQERPRLQDEARERQQEQRACENEELPVLPRHVGEVVVGGRRVGEEVQPGLPPGGHGHGQEHPEHGPGEGGQGKGEVPPARGLEQERAQHGGRGHERRLPRVEAEAEEQERQSSGESPRARRAGRTR